MLSNPAVLGTKAFHYDGCSPSIGIGAIPGNTFFDGIVPFHAGDPWGFHMVMSKHCKHHIHTILGAAVAIVDDRPLAVTDFPVLSCGSPMISPAVNVLIKVV